MNHPASKTCTEANMFLCMCKIKALTLAYRDCACSKCLTPQSKLDAIATGKDICNRTCSPYPGVKCEADNSQSTRRPLLGSPIPALLKWACAWV